LPFVFPAATPELPVARYRLEFATAGQPRLPAYAGSAWRGALGHSLRRTVCVTRLPTCTGCLLVGSCAYPYVFETPPPPQAQKMRRYTAAPHPFVLEVPCPDGTGEDLPYRLGLVLFGRGNQYLPYLVQALQQAGEEQPCSLSSATDK
jgi:hypothetical protein